jgi:WD40 repeat protein/serine/threonine protein kinase
MSTQGSEPEASQSPVGQATEAHASPDGGVAPATAAPQRMGDFRILRVIGTGGMGVVYEAEQVSLGRHVALKVMPLALRLDATRKARFEREARAAAKLHHTNIVPVFGVGEHDGLPYYVMQLIDGRGLDVVLLELRSAPATSIPATLVASPPVEPGPVEIDVTLTAASPISGTSRTPPAARAPAAVLPSSGGSSSSGAQRASYWRDVARIGAQVADALEYAHRQGILHRDVKPSNLLLDAQGTVWVTDFGLAKADDSDNLTQAGDIIGTLRYMPPEAFEGRSDRGTDVYALGLTLYELVALRPAYGEADRKQLVKQVMTTEPERLDRINPAIPRDLVTIVHKAADRDAARRYQTAGELAADLRRFLADEPIRARRVSHIERYVRWARRNPGIALLGGALTAVLLVGLVASLVAAGYLNRLRLNEAEAADEARRRGDAERWERYRSNIAAASAAFQVQNSGAARSALEDAPQEHRNWEWQYLHSQLDGASLVLSVPGGKVLSLVLSPSGRQFAVCCFDHNDVYLYDVATGRLDAVLRGHSAPATSVAYRSDGKQVATASNDQTIRLWDPLTGQQTALLKADVAPSNLDRDSDVVYSSDGSRIASAGSDASDDGGGTSRLWDANAAREIAVLAKWQKSLHPVGFSPDGKRVAASSGESVYLCDAVTGRRLALLGPHARAVKSLAYSSDGKRIVSVIDRGTNAFHLWDGESGKEIAALPAPFGGPVRFSPDSTRLVTASDYPDNTARLWDAATGRLLAVLAGHKNAIWSVAFSPDGKRMVTGSSDQTARIWDGHTGQLLAVLNGHAGHVNHVVFSPDGTHVVTASTDATLRLWDAETGQLVSVLRGHGNSFNCAPVFTLDGSRLVSGSHDGTARIWDMSLVERNGILKGHTSYVYDVAFSPDGEQVASAAWDGTTRLWDATTGRETRRLKHETNMIVSVAYSRDGRRLATGEVMRGIALWDVASPKVPRDSWFEQATLVEPCRAGLNPQGTLLAAGSQGGPVYLWDVATGREVTQLDGHESFSQDVAFHPDGSLLATTGADGTVRLWDVARRALVAVLRGHSDSVTRAAFGADGKLLASGSHDGTVRLWDTETREPLGVIPVGGIVYGVAFSPDGTRLAAACRDNTIRLIDVASRQQVAELHGHTDYVHAVDWSPDGTRLVSGSGDYTVRVWDSLSVQERARRAVPLEVAR